MARVVYCRAAAIPADLALLERLEGHRRTRRQGAVDLDRDVLHGGVAGQLSGERVSNGKNGKSRIYRGPE